MGMSEVRASGQAQPAHTVPEFMLEPIHVSHGTMIFPLAQEIVVSVLLAVVWGYP